MSTISFEAPTVARTMTSALVAEIRTDIVRGQFEPGARLRIKALMERYGAGMIPVREALSRLASSGLVIAEDQRGFSVAPVSTVELQELTKLRKQLETDALRASIAGGDLDWESRMISAHHRLKRQPKLESTVGMAESWDVAHRGFHMALLSACTARWTMQFVEVLSDQMNRYRHLSVNAEKSERHVENEHNDLLEAALARDADKACELLREHLTRTEARAMHALQNRAIDAA
jgi:GntR family carbon starvation induced transcriptional regulator